MKNILLKSISVVGILSFVGCGGFNYRLTSNVPNTKVDCGFDKNNMKFCYTTPFIRMNTPSSLSWSNKYFQAHKDGYVTSAIYQQPTTMSDAFIHFNLVKGISEKPSPKIKTNEQKEIINKFISSKDLQGLKKYTDKNPSSVYYITDNKLRLILTGPQGMKVGDIKKLITKGRSETIITALIQRVKVPYKEFTLEEIDLLTQMKLSDNIIAAMINVTTELLKNEEKKKQQQFYLNEQKRNSQQQTKVIYRTTPTNNNTVGDKLQDAAIKQGVGMLLDQLF